jgi:hypothetical protein
LCPYFVKHLFCAIILYTHQGRRVVCYLVFRTLVFCKIYASVLHYTVVKKIKSFLMLRALCLSSKYFFNKIITATIVVRYW